MLVLLIEQVVPQLSCPIALFSYYNPILKRGTEKFMSTIKDVGVHGNVYLLLVPNRLIDFIKIRLDITITEMLDV